ncbi:MAG: TIGR04282 family arsenosugar biosynthesis glycosyltransferase [Pseudomonadota bacterium]
MQFPEARILVFCKAPVPGKVKTRLMPALTATEAAELHRRLALHTLEKLKNAQLCPVDLWCSPDTHDPFFAECRNGYAAPLHKQTGADLGEKMHRALKNTLSECPYVLLIGCDCPSLTSSDLTEAFNALKRGADAVLGPAADGGYVLIGLRSPQRELFHNIAWGTDTVLGETRHRLGTLCLTWTELPTLWDIDRMEDLERLRTMGFSTKLL